MTIILRVIAWLLAAAVTFFNLGPPRYRPHSDLGQHGEHALPFVLVGLAFAVAYPKHRSLASALSVVVIGVIELLQMWVPGRHARLGDFVVDALACLGGLAFVSILDWLRRLHWHSKPS